ncbi:MFS transporter, partial [Rhizobiaceae sp. 2RAB30]
ELISGALSDRHGRRRIALVAVSVFVVASIGCALAPNIYLFLMFRALQASIAACFAVALVMIKETSSEKEAASRMGYAAMGWAIAPMLGPTLGGLLNEVLGWRAIFVLLAISGAALLVVSFRDLKEPAARATAPKAGHLESYALLLGSARFWAYALCMACSMGTLYIFFSGAPLVVGPTLETSSATLGLYMGMVPAGFVLGSYLTGRIATRMSPGPTLVLARLSTCLGLACGLILAIAGGTHPLAFFGPCVFIGIGNGLTLPTANMGVMSERRELAGTAVGLAAAISIGGGAVIASVAGLFLGGPG